uniref:BPTI/Kunitz inhibitor domain-containing protein n=1 Tax=Oryzias sinensis TaxID=183150 RepID=A0A8C7YS25_9TELE
WKRFREKSQNQSNSQAGACRPFIYSGCGGNSNRFLHQEECEELCLGKAEGINRIDPFR